MLTQSTETYREVLQVAENLYRQTPDWVTFFREVLGIDGAVRKRFPTFEELSAFEKSDEFDQIQKMLVKLREKRTTGDSDAEPTRVITVRLPKSMHEYLRTEAHDMRTSMNKLCISKLLQVIGEEMIPNERTGGSSGGGSNAGGGNTGQAPASGLPQQSTPQPQQNSGIGLHQPPRQQPPLQQPPLPQTPLTQSPPAGTPSPFKPTNNQPRF